MVNRRLLLWSDHEGEPAVARVAGDIGGEDGVQRVADLLTADIVRTMALLGVRTVADLQPGMVRLP